MPTDMFGTRFELGVAGSDLKSESNAAQELKFRALSRCPRKETESLELARLSEDAEAERNGI